MVSKLMMLASCGLSDGDYVSLGYYEHLDIDCVIDFLLETYDFIDRERYLNKNGWKKDALM